MRKKALLVALVCAVAAISLMSVSAEGAKKGAKVKEGSVVKVHYTLKVEGEVVDSSEGGDPMEVKIGSGQVIPGFEKAIMGMKVGEKKTFTVPPEDAYGNPDPEVIQVVSKDNMPPGELEVGMVLFAQSPNGERFPARITEIREDEVVMDFNHPLAGKTLEFTVEIVSID